MTEMLRKNAKYRSKFPVFRFGFLWLLAVTLLLTIASQPQESWAQNSTSPCDFSTLADHLKERNLPVQHVEKAQEGAILLLGETEGPPKALVWFGILDSKDLATSSEITSNATDKTRWDQAIQDTLNRLGEDPHLYKCPEFVTTQARNIADLRPDLRKRLQPNEQNIFTPFPHHGIDHQPMFLVNKIVILAVWAFYLLGLAWLLAGGIKHGKTRELLVMAFFFVAALAVRLLSSERLPIGSGHGDFTHLKDMAIWTFEGWDVYLGQGYKPTYRLPLYLLMQLFGPSSRLVFTANAVVGALAVIPAYAAGRRLSGTVWGGSFSALAVLAFPPLIFFSNGLVIGPMAGLLLAASFAHLLAWLERDKNLDLALFLCTLLLFVQCRGESSTVAAMAGMIQFFMILERNALGRLLKRWPLLLVSILFLFPHLYLMTNDLNTVDPETRRHFFSILLSFAVTCTAFGLLALSSRTAFSRWPRSRWLWIAFVITLTTTMLFAVISRGLGPLLVATPNPLVPYPFVTTFNMPTGLKYGWLSEYWNYWMDVGLYPLVFFPLWLLSLLPKALGTQRNIPVALPLLLLLPGFGTQLILIQSGLILAEGLRYQLSYLVLLCVSVGVGAAFFLENLPLKGHLRAALAVALAACLLSPLVTHRRFTADTRHNIQNETEFVQRMVEVLPNDSHLLISDSRYSGQPGGIVTTERLFRTADLLQGAAYLEGKKLLLADFGKFFEKPRNYKDVYFYFGMGCYHVPRVMDLDPLCEAVRRVAKTPPVVQSHFVNRRYSDGGYIENLGPWIPEVDIALYRLNGEELDRLFQWVERNRTFLDNLPESAEKITYPIH